MLTRFIMVITSQYVQISNHYAGHLKLAMLYVNYISISKKLKHFSRIFLFPSSRSILPLPFRSAPVPIYSSSLPPMPDPISLPFVGGPIALSFNLLIPWLSSFLCPFPFSLFLSFLFFF